MLDIIKGIHILAVLGIMIPPFADLMSYLKAIIGV